MRRNHIERLSAFRDPFPQIAGEFGKRLVDLRLGDVSLTGRDMHQLNRIRNRGRFVRVNRVAPCEDCHFMSEFRKLVGSLENIHVHSARIQATWRDARTAVHANDRQLQRPTP